MVLTPGFQFLALGVQAAFELANAVKGEDYYTLSIASVKAARSPRPAALPSHRTARRSRAGRHPAAARRPCASATAGRSNARNPAHDCKRIRRVAGLCTGAFLLGQMGLLDGRRATTHWSYARQMREDFPNVRVEDDRIFINEGAVWTSAGLTAGLDLAVALIEKDLGRDVAGAIARRLVMHHRRAGGQSQHSELLELAPSSDRIQKAVIFAKAHLANPLTVEELAEVAASRRASSRAPSAPKPARPRPRRSSRCDWRRRG
jgi:transcriptional regulator GlxA family with amidase domain